MLQLLTLIQLLHIFVIFFSFKWEKNIFFCLPPTKKKFIQIVLLTKKIFLAIFQEDKNDLVSAPQRAHAAGTARHEVIGG